MAGGFKAVANSVQHMIREVGLIGSLITLSKLNQQNGYDCPGCAWPDPDHERSWAEFCENGAKAIAEEASQRK